MKSREQAVREAEAIKDTDQEIEGLTPVNARISPNLGTVYSLRFSAAEMSLLREAARERGIKLSELIREGALASAAQASGRPTPREEAIEEARELVGAAAKVLDKLSHG